jgi:hypothetical protein
LLFDNGASPSARDNAGCTPKDWTDACGKSMTIDLPEDDIGWLTLTLADEGKEDGAQLTLF